MKTNFGTKLGSPPPAKRDNTRGDRIEIKQDNKAKKSSTRQNTGVCKSKDRETLAQNQNEKKKKKKKQHPQTHPPHNQTPNPQKKQKKKKKKKKTILSMLHAQIGITKAAIQSPQTAHFRQHHGDMNEKEGKKNTPQLCSNKRNKCEHSRWAHLNLPSASRQRGRIKHEGIKQRKHQCGGWRTQLSSRAIII